MTSPFDCIPADKQPFEARRLTGWIAGWFRPERERWGVFFNFCRLGMGRKVAEFRGIYAWYRARQRAERLSGKWKREHMPKPTAVPTPRGYFTSDQRENV